MKEIDKQIQEARPPLRIVSPLAYLIILGFAYGNVLLAPAFLLVPLRSLVVIPNRFSQWAFTIAFELLAFALLWGIHKNNWQLLRRALIGGLCLKSIIMFALIISLVTDGWGVFGSAVLWAMLSYFQAATLIHPMPTLGLPTSAVVPDEKESGK